MINNKHKCIFVRVAKAGSFSIMRAFNNSTRGEQLKNIATSKDWPHDINHVPLPTIKSLVSPEVYKSYFKFAFVRNPWDRIVSQYYFGKRYKKLK